MTAGVVALGGCASAGKTTAATELARILGHSDIVHVDELSRQLETSGRPHFLTSCRNPWQQPGEVLADRLIDWTQGLHPLILDAAEQLSSAGGIIEGEGVDPRLADRWRPGVSVVYLIELDPRTLWATFARRAGSSSHFLALSAGEQSTVVDMNIRYSRWLLRAAEQAGQPWVPSRPWATLATRCADVLR